MEISVLMGHAPAKVDDKGRIKIPNAFRRIIEERFGLDCFITSFDGEKALIYPLPAWQEYLSRLEKVPTSSVAKQKLLEAVNYYGQLDTMDTQGRVLVPSILRNVASIQSDVVVLGSNNHLIVWNEEKIQSRMTARPLSADDLKELELHGV